MSSFHSEQLPESVEQLLTCIATLNHISPASQEARLRLSELGEEKAVDLLRRIISCPRTSIKNLSRDIIVSIEKEFSEEKSSSPGVSNVISESSRGRSLDTSNSESVPLRRCSLTDTAGTSLTGDGNYLKGFEREPSTSVHTPICERDHIPPHLNALGELAFPKAFLVLAYTAPCPLEKFLSVRELLSFKEFSMAAVEKRMRETLSSNPTSAFQFPIQLLQKYNWHDWNPDKDENHGYDRMPGPLKSGRKTHLQRVCGDSNVLQVHFAEDMPAGSKSEYGRIGKKGLCVGLRHYRFFVFKKSDKNEKEKQNNIVKTSVKCYFVCTSSLAKTDKNVSYDLFKNSMQDARCHFMHIHTVGTLKKYMHRFALVLSHTVPFDDDLSIVNLEEKEDILCRDENNDPASDVNGEHLIHTDGTGFISEDLASKIPVNVINGKQSEKQSSEECSPLLTQCRIFYNGMAIKGTLLSNRTLPENTICVRKSMVKVKRDDKYVGCSSKNSLEIVKTGYKPTTAKLSRPLIALLIYGGVPEELFINLSQKALNELKIECHEEGRAWKVLKQFSGLDDDYTALRMLACGIPLNEPYLQDRLKQLIQSEVKSIRKGKFRLENSYYLMGTADPSGKLKPDEVCIILEHGQVSGKVLVYRNPGSHFGDIHIYTAVYVKEIEEIVGDRKYAIFFSTRGKRSGADEIGGGDFDGDEYWVCKNSQILHYYKPQKPWERPIKLEEEALQRKPTDYLTEELEEKLFKEYLDCRFSTSFVIGKAADSWLVYMDRLLTPGVTGKDGLKEKILRLVDIYYDALDAPKTGKTVQLPAGLVPEKRPHFLNKESFINTEKFYISSSILGKLWDLQNTNEMDREDEISDLPCFQETTEECKNIWKKHYKEYLEQMHTALGSLDSKPSAAQIYTKYKEKLYEARSLQESTKNRKLIYKEACAIYQIAYKEARAKRDAGRCGFAWRVAGEAFV